MKPFRVTNKYRAAFRYCAMAFGIDFYMPTPDREVLETIIFPYLIQRQEFQNVLFIGCDWYTRGYNKTFQHKNFYTLDIDPTKRKYGSAKHIVDTAENIHLHFKKCELDLIICNGVFGWGLNEKLAVEKTFHGCFDCLREDGILIIGWNNVPAKCPFSLDECLSIQKFQPFVFPPLGTYQLEAGNKHVYNFYTR